MGGVSWEKAGDKGQEGQEGIWREQGMNVGDMRKTWRNCWMEEPKEKHLEKLVGCEWEEREDESKLRQTFSR